MKIKKIWKQDGQEDIITLAEAKKLIQKEYANAEQVIKMLRNGYGVDCSFSYLEPID